MKTKPTLIVLETGDRLEHRGEDDRGLHSDAGIHPWSEVLGLLVWSRAHQIYMSIPID